MICLAYSPDGRWLASTSGNDGPIRLRGLEGQPAARLIGRHSRTRNAVAFSPDGRLLAATGTDADIRLWDLAEILGAEMPGGLRATD